MHQFTVNDMSCGHCVGVVTDAAKSVDPKAAVKIDLATKRVEIDSAREASAFVAALEDAGYPATPAPENAATADPSERP